LVNRYVTNPQDRLFNSHEDRQDKDVEIDMSEQIGHICMPLQYSDPRTPYRDARGRIAALEEQVNQHDDISMLQDKVSQLSTEIGCLGGEVSTLRSTAAEIQTVSEEVSVLKTQIGQKLREIRLWNNFRRI
jgi:hypothetical protein